MKEEKLAIIDAEAKQQEENQSQAREAAAVAAAAQAELAGEPVDRFCMSMSDHHCLVADKRMLQTSTPVHLSVKAICSSRWSPRITCLRPTPTGTLTLMSA
jgi:hypothetical protein